MPQYKDHIYHCSTRTTPCEYCHKYITLRDFDFHVEKCKHSFPLLEDIKGEENKELEAGEDEEYAKKLQE